MHDNLRKKEEGGGGRMRRFMTKRETGTQSYVWCWKNMRIIRVNYKIIPCSFNFIKFNPTFWEIIIQSLNFNIKFNFTPMISNFGKIGWIVEIYYLLLVCWSKNYIQIIYNINKNLLCKLNYKLFGDNLLLI